MRASDGRSPFDLTKLSGTRISVSVTDPTGGASGDPAVLLGNDPAELDGKPISEFTRSRTYDTYDGRNRASGFDWYEIEFPRPVRVNRVHMVMGLPYRDGGWWMDVHAEILTEDGDWRVPSQSILPELNREDSGEKRLPFEPYDVLFDDVVTRAVRITGRPGGIAEFTSLSHIGVYHDDRPAVHVQGERVIPTPLTYSLIQPNTLWDLSEGIMKVTDLLVSCDLLEYFLYGDRFRRYWRRLEAAYHEAMPLWFLVGDRMGWRAYNSMPSSAVDHHGDSTGPFEIRHDAIEVLSTVAVPLVADGIYLGTLTTMPQVIIVERECEETHRRTAAALGIPWDEYSAASALNPRVSQSAIEGIGSLLGTIGRLIVEQAHRNILLKKRLDGHENRWTRQERARRATVEAALQWMEDHAEDNISVRDAAGVVGVSNQQLSRLFRTVAGCSAVDALSEIKLTHAKALFDHEQMSVTDVAVALGYNPQYFSRLFRRRVGMSPSEYLRSRSV